MKIILIVLNYYKIRKSCWKNKNNKRLYKVLSNLTCEEHNFDDPERKSKFKEESENEIKLKLISSNHYKEYYIITNDYKLFNVEKISMIVLKVNFMVMIRKKISRIFKRKKWKSIDMKRDEIFNTS